LNVLKNAIIVILKVLHGIRTFTRGTLVLMLTWWHEEVLFSCRSLAVRNAADWGTRRLASRGIRFRKRSRSLWQGEWLLLKRIKYSRVICAWCHYVNSLSESMHNGRRKTIAEFYLTCEMPSIVLLFIYTDLIIIGNL